MRSNKSPMEELIYAIILLFLAIILTFAFSPIIHSEINADIASSDHYGFTLDAGVLGALAVILDLHGLLAIMGEIVGTMALIYKTYV
jgi:hypothetical protein